MKITDETKEFSSTHRFGTDRLVVSSNYPGEHTTPSLFLGIFDPATGREAAFGTKDTVQIKEIIEHMAKMAGLEVEITKPFVPQFQPGDRVRSLASDNYKGELGTVVSDTEHDYGWNVRVRYDKDTDGGGLFGLFMYNELERVDSGSLDVRDTVHVMGRDGIMTGTVVAINLSAVRHPFLVEFEDGHREFHNRDELTKKSTSGLDVSGE